MKNIFYARNIFVMSTLVTLICIVFLWNTKTIGHYVLAAPNSEGISPGIDYNLSNTKKGSKDIVIAPKPLVKSQNPTDQDDDAIRKAADIEALPNSDTTKSNEIEKLPGALTPSPLDSIDVDALAKDPNALHTVIRTIKDLAFQVESLKKSVKRYPPVAFKNYKDRKRILITGGAGFVGSHLADRLMMEGHEVVVVDNFFTGRKRNVEHWVGHPNFQMINHDVVNPLYIEVDQVYHLASPASPIHYMYNAIKTVKTNTMGTINMLGLTKRNQGRLLMASTSEIYGDPEEHPQKEEYWGHVNPIGPRACYDEAKRVAETICYAYAKQEQIEVRVARIFNTYGPRMHMNDGRVVSNFILQSLKGEPITLYGDGKQTRSFQYVSDLVNGLIALMNSNYSRPVNLGNPDEFTIAEFASEVKRMTHSKSEIVMKPAVEDDPHRRKPDITRAKTVLHWEPTVKMAVGVGKTIEYFKAELGRQFPEKHGDWIDPQ